LKTEYAFGRRLISCGAGRENGFTSEKDDYESNPILCNHLSQQHITLWKKIPQNGFSPAAERMKGWLTGPPPMFSSQVRL
jgi:hypothetical protein